MTILPQSEIARAELITSDDDEEIIGSDSEYINQVVSDQTDITQIPINEPKDKWPISALKGELKEKLPSNVVVQWDNLIQKETDNINHEESLINVNYVQVWSSMDEPGLGTEKGLNNVQIR